MGREKIFMAVLGILFMIVMPVWGELCSNPRCSIPAGAQSSFWNRSWAYSTNRPIPTGIPEPPSDNHLYNHNRKLEDIYPYRKIPCFEKQLSFSLPYQYRAHPPVRKPG